MFLAALFFVIVTGTGTRTVYAQSLSEEIWTSVRNFFLPSVVVRTYDLRAFIVQLPPLPVSAEAHRERINIIWDHAVFLADGNIDEALFAAAAATLPYHSFPAYLPLLGWVIRVPVSTESEEEFRKRLMNLPSRLYDNGKDGSDRDKLPHFFGSAWLQYRFHSEFLTAASGEMIEMGEKFFKLEGAYDERDIDANARGRAFGAALLNGESRRPSEYFQDNSPEHSNHYGK